MVTRRRTKRCALLSRSWTRRKSNFLKTWTRRRRPRLRRGSPKRNAEKAALGKKFEKKSVRGSSRNEAAVPDHFRVILQPRASNDIIDACAYIERDSPQNAASVARELLDA